jgi:hypothetical protein
VAKVVEVKTKKLSLSKKLEVVYEVIVSLGDFISREEEKLKAMRLEILFQCESIKQ